MGVADPGASPVSSAVVRLNVDGSLTVSVGSTEIGQGVRTVMLQIAGETMGVRSKKWLSPTPTSATGRMTTRRVQAVRPRCPDLLSFEQPT